MKSPLDWVIEPVVTRESKEPTNAVVRAFRFRFVLWMIALIAPAVILGILFDIWGLMAGLMISSIATTIDAAHQFKE